MATQLLCENGACSGSGGPGCAPQTYSINGQASITGSASITSGAYFFSDGPEDLYDSTTNTYYLADPPNASSGYWLLKESVAGGCHLFLWHGNNTGYTVNSQVLLYNPNSFTVTVIVPNYGAGTGFANGVDMWFQYWSSSSVSYSVASGGYLAVPVISISNIANGDVYGVVAQLQFQDPSGNPATMTVYDLAYISNDSTAFTQAPNSTNGVRGMANGFWVPINVSLTIATASVPVDASLVTQFTCAATGDSLGGSDVPTVTGPGGSTYSLNGCFGCQLYVSLTVTNGDPSNAHSFVISVGCLPNNSPVEFAIDYTAGPGGCDSINNGTGLTSGEYLNIISDTLAAGANATYQFQLTSGGGYSTPLAVGVTVTA